MWHNVYYLVTIHKKNAEKSNVKTNKHKITCTMYNVGGGGGGGGGNHIKVY